MRTCLAIFFLVSSLTAFRTLAGDVLSKEKESLQGTWAPVSVDENGKPYPAEKIKGFKLTIKGDKQTYKVDAETFTGSYKIAVNKKPKEMDIAFDNGPQKGKTMLAIYALDGDELKVCGGFERPTEFVSKEASKVILMVFKREKP